MREFLKKSALFLSLAAGIYACYIVSAVYHQKILKKPYQHITTQEQKNCSESLIFTLFPPLFATLIGQAILFFQKSKNSQSSNLPLRNCAVISAIININMFTYNQAVVHASFPAVVMAKSCSLLSVIIVGVFFSRVKDSKLRLTHKKLLIGLLATCGIVLFNFFKKQEKDALDQPLKFFSVGNLYLIVSLVGDGFLPDFQAQLKSEFKPSTIEMYCKINRTTFLISLVLCLVSGSIFRIFDFILNYQDFGVDIAKMSLLNAVGQLFIYRMIKQFRQHIPAFVIAFRKCLTVIVNILWFNHSINREQIVGIGLVFLAVFWEVYSNYREEQQKQAEKFSEIMQQDPETVKIQSPIASTLSVNEQINDKSFSLQQARQQAEQA